MVRVVSYGKVWTVIDFQLQERGNPGKRVARGIRFVHYERMVSIVRRVSSTLMDSKL